MSKKLFPVISVLMIAAFIFAACTPKTETPATDVPGTGEETGNAPGDWNIVMVTPYGAVPYWQQIEAGMNAANADLGTNAEYIGPSDLNLDEQLKAIDTAIASQVDGIITNGYVPESMEPLFVKAQEAGIPVVLVDADAAEGSVRVSYIGTSNEAAGYQAGQAMAECMGGEGQIAIITGVIGSSNIDDRVSGFERALEEFPGMEVVTMEVSNVDLQVANEKAGAILTAYPDVVGLYGTTEPDIIGAAQVVDERGLEGMCLVGFDDATQTIDYIKEGVIYGTIVQKPFMMGYMGVQVMLDILNGKEVDSVYDTGVTTVTKSNVYTYNETAETKDPSEWNIVLVTPYGAVPYWQQIEAGMNAANADFGASVEYIGPADLNLDEQLKAIDTAIASQVDGIITNGYVPESFEPLFVKAQEAGIPVVLVDADAAEGSVRVSYIGTSNEAAGYQAGQAMAECMGGEGQIAIITGVIGSSNIDDRVSGFERALEEFPGLEVVTMEVSNVDLQIANEKAGAILTAYPDVVGLYGTTEPDIIGAAQVVSERGLEGMCLVGFDDATQTLDYIRDGVIYGTIVQKPFMMGYMGVQVMLDILNGKEVDSVYDTGVTTVTIDNVDSYK